MKLYERILLNVDQWDVTMLLVRCANIKLSIFAQGCPNFDKKRLIDIIKLGSNYLESTYVYIFFFDITTSFIREQTKKTNSKGHTPEPNQTPSYTRRPTITSPEPNYPEKRKATTTLKLPWLKNKQHTPHQSIKNKITNKED